MTKAEQTFEKLAVSAGAIERAISNAVKKGKSAKKIKANVGGMSNSANTGMQKNYFKNPKGARSTLSQEQAIAIDNAAKKHKM